MTLDQVIADAQATRAEAVARGATAVVADCDAVLADCAALSGTSGLPSWVPSVGQVRNVALNTMHSVDPCPSQACAWSGTSKQGGGLNDVGMVFCAALGSLGSYVWTIGGHNDYYGNELYRYDVATRLVSLVTNPDPLTFGMAASPPLPAGNVNVGYFGDTTLGEVWADATYTATKQNAPASGHLYGYIVPIPPGVAGMGAMGGVMRVCTPSMSAVGSKHGRQSHILDFAAQLAVGPNNPQWKRIGGLVPSAIPAYGGACLDMKRMTVWATEGTGTNGIPYRLDLNAASPQWAYVPGFPWGGFVCHYGTVMYSPEYDRIVYFRNHQNGNAFAMIDPTAPTKVLHPALTGDLPPPLDPTKTIGGGSDWCADLPGGPGIVYYLGMGGFDIYVLQPTDATLTTWRGTRMTLTGDTPPVQASPLLATHLGRFRYAPSVRCFHWIATNGAPIQAWRLMA